MADTDLVIAVRDKIKDFIEKRKDFDMAFQLDLNHDRMTTLDIRLVIERARAMSNLVSKYLADTELLEKNLASRVVLADDALEDGVMDYIQKMPQAEYGRFAKEERRRIALIANTELRTALQTWEAMLADVKSFKKTLDLAMENIRGARKDILGAIGAAKLDQSWEPGSLGRDVDFSREALQR